MTVDEFLLLPHRQKDDIVQEYVLGDQVTQSGWYRDKTYGDVNQTPHYSTDLRSAIFLGTDYNSFRLSKINYGEWLCSITSGRGLEQWWGINADPAIAIVLACLNQKGYFTE